MTLRRFVFGLLLTAGIVAAWSVWSEAGWGTVVLRLVVTAIVLQVGYVASVAWLALREARSREAGARDVRKRTERGARVGTPRDEVGS